jgi:hypothetical protein
MHSHRSALHCSTWSFLVSRGIRVLTSRCHSLERFTQLELTFTPFLLLACMLRLEFSSWLAVAIAFTHFLGMSAPRYFSTFAFAFSNRLLQALMISLVTPGMSCFHLVCWRRDLLEQPIRPLAWLFVT